MFEKTGTVGFMIRNHRKLAEILAEIDKCQLLCISCHKKVTSYENKCGFISMKRLLNKNIRKKQDITEMQTVLISQYRDKMEPFYAKMRATCGKLDENCDTGVMTAEIPT